MSLITAIRKKYRFTTNRGNVTMEDLYDMPLTYTGNPEQDDGFHLNKVAQDLSKQININQKEDFVSTKTKIDKTLIHKLDIVKQVIKIRLEELKDRADAAEQKLLRDKARKILANRADSKLDELSDKELKKLAK